MNVSETQNLIRQRETAKVVRPLGAFEHLFWLIDQNMPQHFAVAAQFVGRASPSDWRAALDRAQERHPLLSVRIERAPGQTPYFREAKDAAIPLRIVEYEPRHCWEKEVGEELATSFDPYEAPLLRAVLIQGMEDAAIILVAHHSIADGLSLVYLLRDLFHHVAGGGLERLPMRPSMHDLLLLHPESIGTTVEDPQRASPNGPPSSIRRTDGARAAVRSARLAPNLLAKLKQRSRAEKTTVQGALCAAVALAGRQLSDEWSERTLRLLSPINIRPLLGIGDDVGLFVSGSNIVFDRRADDFWAAARQVTDTLGQDRTRAAVEAASLGMQHVAVRDASVASAAEFSATAFAREGMVTNLGDLPIPTQYDDLRITALWGPLISTGVEGDQSVGAASLDGWLHLVHVSHTPINGLLPAMQDLIVEACLS